MTARRGTCIFTSLAVGKFSNTFTSMIGPQSCPSRSKTVRVVWSNVSAMLNGSKVFRSEELQSGNLRRGEGVFSSNSFFGENVGT